MSNDERMTKSESGNSYSEYSLLEHSGFLRHFGIRASSFAFHFAVHASRFLLCDVRFTLAVSIR